MTNIEKQKLLGRFRHRLETINDPWFKGWSQLDKLDYFGVVIDELLSEKIRELEEE